MTTLRDAVEALPNQETCFCEHDRRVQEDEVYLHRSAVLALIDAHECTPEAGVEQGLDATIRQHEGHGLRVSGGVVRCLVDGSHLIRAALGTHEAECGLDVERLATAIWNALYPGEAARAAMNEAEAIAAEYAALRRP
jgi:hypothetical protein